MNKGKRQLARRRQRDLRKRRGVLLIIVLSLLVLFALIGFTFVLVAGQYSRAAAATQRANLTSDDGRQIAEMAFLDIVRGTLNPNSALYSHDDDGDGAIDEDPIDGTDDDGDGLIDEDPIGRIHCASLLEDLYGTQEALAGLIENPVANGDFLAFDVDPTTVTGPALSQYWGYYAGRVITLVSGAGTNLSSRVVHCWFDSSGSRHIFICEAFKKPDGTAVVPNAADAFLLNGRPLSGQQGMHANEDWDAPDRLNPHLGLVPSNATNPSSFGTPAERLVIPSYIDRAVLFDSNGDGTPDANFTRGGSPLSGDLRVVDNDHDSVFDSNWFDFGYETKTAPDGRRYKPLISVLCVDLDGRINVNAHGSLAQTAPAYTGTTTKNWAGPFPTGGAIAKNVTPRGMAASPADVQLSAISTSAEATALLQDKYASGADPADFVPGARHSVIGIDYLYRLHSVGIPDNYNNQSTTPQGYGSPIDLHGASATGVDYSGRMIFENVGVDEMKDPPTEINLVSPNGLDSPYHSVQSRGSTPLPRHRFRVPRYPLALPCAN